MNIHRFIKFYLSPILVLGLIYFVWAANVLSFTKDIESTENRKFAEKPQLNINNLDGFPKKYEKYYNDNFPMRNYLIQGYNNSIINYLGRSPLPEFVIFGKGDWMYYGEKHIKVYRGTEHYSKNEIEEIKKELLYRYEYLKKRGIKYYFVVLPTKYTIYPEFIPDNVTRLYNKTITDQLLEAFNGNAPFRLIDTRQALLDAKKHNVRLFQKTDAHWNSAGAFFAYQKISEYLTKDFPDKIETRKFEDYSVDSLWEKGGDLTKLLGTYEKSKEMQIYLRENFKSEVYRGKESGYDPKGFAAKDDYEIVCINPKQKNKLKGLVIRDSFTGFMVQFLQEDFYKSTYIFDRWEYGLNEEIVENEKPDVFINIVVECHLKNLLAHLSYKNAK